MEFVCGYSGSCFHKADFESGVHAEWMTKEKLSGTDKAAEMECYKQRWVGAILVSALVAESRNCRHGFFSSSGTGCGIRGIAWAGLHDDMPEKGLTLSASCRGMTVSCPAHPCGGRKIFQIIPWEDGGQELRRSIHALVFKSVSAIFLPGGARFPWIWECPCAAGC